MKTIILGSFENLREEELFGKDEILCNKKIYNEVSNFEIITLMAEVE